MRHEGPLVGADGARLRLDVPGERRCSRSCRLLRQERLSRGRRRVQPDDGVLGRGRGRRARWSWRGWASFRRMGLAALVVQVVVRRADHRLRAVARALGEQPAAVRRRRRADRRRSRW